jgi:Helix-turn-helix domain
VSGPAGIQVKRRRQRFAMVPHAVVRNPDLSDKAVRLYGVLESYADYTDRDCWPSVETLATDCGRCHRATVQRAVRELVKARLLQVDSGKAAGQPNVYTLLDPPNCVQGVMHPRATPSRASAPPGEAPTREGGRAPARDKQDPVQRDPVNTTGEMATDDPVVRQAHRLTVLAFEQTPRPITRGGFPTVLARIEEQLRAGCSVQRIEAAVRAGDVTWTRDGLQTAISRANPRARRNGNRDGDGRSLEQLVSDARKAEKR